MSTGGRGRGGRDKADGPGPPGGPALIARDSGPVLSSPDDFARAAACPRLGCRKR
jgi:hypothetical protein